MRMETAISGNIDNGIIANKDTDITAGAANKISELEERMRRTEDSSKENKNALSQLISHTKNVERAVTMSQQVNTLTRILAGDNVGDDVGHVGKEGAAGDQDTGALSQTSNSPAGEGDKHKDLSNLTTLFQNRETLERTCYVIRDDV